MTTDNRTNEPTEADALRQVSTIGWHSESVGVIEVVNALSNADRLVAAQGAAPQAESEPKLHTRVVTRSFDSDCALGICMSGCSHLMWVCDSCSSEGGWGAARGQLKKWAAEHVCPVLPSSGVDEEVLARLLCEKNYLSPDGKPTCAACRDKAHEVAEWLEARAAETREGK